MHKKNLLLLGFTSAIVSILVACGSRNTRLGNYEPYTSVDGLVLNEKRSPERVYIRPDVPDLGAYDRFLIGAIQLDMREAAEAKVPEEDVHRIKDYLSAAITSELEDAGYQMVSEAGAGVMQMDFYISGFSANENGGAVNVGVKVASIATGAFWMPNLFVGKITVEGVFRNSAENRIDAVAVNRAQGRRYFKAKVWSTWADVEDSLDTWAVGIRKSVDKAHGQ